ncbi:hypothetical protein N9L68_04390 [bacterium]|nr:hypothetical protein [bacterium]
MEEAFGPTFSRKQRDIIHHSHRMVTWVRPGAFLSNRQQQQRRRPRRWRPAAPDVQLGKEIYLAVALFLAGEDYSDGESASDEAEFGTTLSPT